MKVNGAEVTSSVFKGVVVFCVLAVGVLVALCVMALVFPLIGVAITFVLGITTALFLTMAIVVGLLTFGWPILVSLSLSLGAIMKTLVTHH